MREALVLCLLSFVLACGIGASSSEGRGATTSAAPTGGVSRDIRYVQGPSAAGPLQSLDVYAPPGAKNLPVVLWVHGGGWQVGDKANVRYKASAFNERGYVFVSTNYRLAPSANYRDMAGDVAAALAWVYRNIANYAGSSDEIYVGGHSAGAHLAALVLADERYLEEVKVPRSAVKGAFLLDSGGYDIPLQLTMGTRRSRGLYTRIFGERLETQRDASPAEYVKVGSRICPVLFIYPERREPSRIQTETMVKKLRGVGLRAEAAAARGASHESLNQDLGKPGHEPTRLVFQFLEGLRP